MAKESGLGANFYLDGVDLSGDTGSLSKISKGLNPIPMTGINKLAHERKAGQLTGGIDWSSFFNPTNAHEQLKTLPRGDRIASYYHRPLLGAPVASCVSKQLNYDPTRANDGALTIDVQTLSNAWWLDWGYALTDGRRVDAVDTNGVGVDFRAANVFGMQIYLQVFAITGGDAVFTLEQSSDNGVGDPWAPVVGGAFAAVVAAPYAERLATARDLAVERYLRVATTGAFTSVDFAVSATVNQTEMTI